MSDEKDIEQEFTSKNTSINKVKNPRIVVLVERQSGWIPRGINLDIGGGKFDNMSDYLLCNHGVVNLIYDPFNRSREHNNVVMSKVMESGADSVTISNVLCVIKEDSNKRRLVMMAFESLRPGGVLYVTNYEGDKSRIGRKTREDQWQENKPSEDYMSLIRECFSQVMMKYGMIIAIKQ